MTRDARELFESDGDLAALARRLYREEVDANGRWPSVPDVRAVLEEEHGFIVIGSGAGRIVVDASGVYPALEGSVVKFALPANGASDGRVQNAVEAAVTGSDHWLTHHAVPVRYADEDGYVTAQPHCGEPTRRQLEAAIGAVAGRAEFRDLYDEDNWGEHHGEARLIDYGFPHATLDLPAAAREAVARVADEEGLEV